MPTSQVGCDQITQVPRTGPWHIPGALSMLLLFPNRWTKLPKPMPMDLLLCSQVSPELSGPDSPGSHSRALAGERLCHCPISLVAGLGWSPHFLNLSQGPGAVSSSPHGAADLLCGLRPTSWILCFPISKIRLMTTSLLHWGVVRIN